MSAGDWKDMYLAACAGDVDLVRFHLENGVDVDYAHPEFQSTALVASVLAGEERVAHLLLDHGADPHLRSPADELTPAEAAQQATMVPVQHRLAQLGAVAPEPARPSGWRPWRRRSSRAH